MKRTEVVAIERAVADEVTESVRCAFHGSTDDAVRHRERARGMRMAINIARRSRPARDRQAETQRGRALSPPGTPPGQKAQ